MKGCHLKLISNLSKNAFWMAFKRFTSRRGKPTIMISDNGKNFLTAFINAPLQKLLREDAELEGSVRNYRVYNLKCYSRTAWNCDKVINQEDDDFTSLTNEPLISSKAVSCDELQQQKPVNFRNSYAKSKSLRFSFNFKTFKIKYTSSYGSNGPRW